MHDAETRALRRAALLLVVVSAVRWGWSRWQAPAPARAGSVLPELLTASQEAKEEEAQRSRPLEDGERVDPNRAGEVQLDRLPGVGPVTARAIIAAREGGMIFREPDDLLAVRGIGPATLTRIRDVLDLTVPPLPRPGGAAGPARRRSAPQLVDVNRATAEELEALPGVGPAIAGRIVAARRERLFTSLDDLVRVRGIGPATLDKLRPYATIGRSP